MTRSEHDEILRSTVRLARLSFSAAAASICLYDPEQDCLVFEASSGEGEDRLIGQAIPSDRGIAGWVANTGEPLIVRGAAEDNRFDHNFAAETGLIPDVIMAAPIEHHGEILGVLEVLDPKLDSVGEMPALDMLTELAMQSCAALSLLISDRKQQANRADAEGPVARLAELLDNVDPRREAALNELISAVSKLLS